MSFIYYLFIYLFINRLDVLLPTLWSSLMDANPTSILLDKLVYYYRFF